MPNGADVPGIPIPVPIPVPGPSFADIGSAIGKFFGGFFGDGGQVFGPELSSVFRGIFERAGVTPVAGGPTGLLLEPIPTPAEGGPPLVTERFRDLPGPFVDPGLGIMPFELRGIPEPESVPQFLPFEPRPIPEPDVLEEDMALDATLLAGFGGPLVRQGTQAVAPTLGAIAGGFLENLFFRPVQETGLGQVPIPQRRQLTPLQAEKPSTRILRMIQNNTGVRVKLSSAKALIRQLGLQNGARCLGISVTDACTLIITPSPRRRRGISGSDIRIVKRTARRFQSLQEDLSGLVSRRRAAPRRRRHVHAIQHTAPAP